MGRSKESNAQKGCIQGLTLFTYYIRPEEPKNQMLQVKGIFPPEQSRATSKENLLDTRNWAGTCTHQSPQLVQKQEGNEIKPVVRNRVPRRATLFQFKLTTSHQSPLCFKVKGKMLHHTEMRTSFCRVRRRAHL